MDKIPVAILGATGTVGQRFVQLLADHPWFEIKSLAASDRSIGKRYVEACHWLLPSPMPTAVCDLLVQPIIPGLEGRLAFSALPSEVAGPAEKAFAQAGYVVCSNSSVHRLEPDVPLLIPEVNADHTALIETQRRQHHWPGFIVTSANCTTTQLTIALKPLHDAFGLRRVFVVSMQAISGAGYPGVPSFDLVDNLIPFINGEEEKVEQESRKLLGTWRQDRIEDAPFVVSAQCNRVPVREGHTECLSLEFERRANPQEVVETLESFRPSAQIAALPSTPAQPIVVRREPNRPQPILDRDTGNGMSVVVGRVRSCPLFDVRLVLLGHNTIRGAAGGAIHNAELLIAQGWLRV
ncbi:MAG: aspartate-semialdehyde dehydrogenase [Anaerolineae bacterium]